MQHPANIYKHLLLLPDEKKEMDYEINKTHMGILVVIILIVSLFVTAFLVSDSDIDLTGYVVFDGAVRVSTAKLDTALIAEINEGNYQPHVVVITDNPDDVLDDLRDDVDVALAEEEPADFAVRKTSESLNIISGQADGDALYALSRNRKVQRIMLDYEVGLSLDESREQISVPLNLTFEAGEGHTVCVIDTGVDYTHPALGNCTPLRYELLGTVEPAEIQSIHPYNDSSDIVWTITKEGYSSIAVHFANISLESLAGGDTLDRIYVYDKNNNTLAVYKEHLADVWTPHGEGDTLYVRLVTDGSVSGYGFFIDSIINGTTNMTMDWSTCPLAGGWDAYNSDADPYDDHGHGTHVAGIIASRDTLYKGVAPSVRIAAVKGLSQSGSGYASDILASLEWCTSHAERLNITAISMSLGCAGGGCVHHQQYCNDDVMAPSIQKAYEQGIPVFIASGNGGWQDGISNPACVEHAVPVGGVNRNDEILFNRGSLLRLLAPATGITSTAPGNGWKQLSGTSMATPHAAAAYVLLRQYYHTLQMPLSADELLHRLEETGKKVIDSSDNSTYARIDLLSALLPELLVDVSEQNGSFLLHVGSDQPLAGVELEFNETKHNFTADTNSSFSLVHPAVEGKYTLNTLTVGGIAVQTEGEFVLAPSPLELSFTALSNFTGNPLHLSITGNNPFHEFTFVLFNATEIFLNQTASGNNSVSAGMSVNLTMEGSLSVVVSALDIHNSTDGISAVIVVDSLPPRLASVASTIVQDAVVLNGTVEDAHLSSVTLDIGNLSVSSNETSFSFMYPLNGSLVFYTVTAVDALGNALTVEGNVTPAGVSPSPIILFPPDNAVLELASSITFTANSSVFWDFGDGTNATGSSVEKQFISSGRYFVTVLNETTANLTIEIKDTTLPEIVSLAYPEEYHRERDGMFFVNASLYDYSPLTADVLLDGSVLADKQCTDDAFSCFWQFSPSDGAHELVLRVVDNASLNTTRSLSFNVLSCTDSQQNGDEEDIDCGGSCPVCSYEVAIQETVPEAVQELTLPEAVVSEPDIAETIPVETIREEPAPNLREELYSRSLQRKEKLLYGLGTFVLLLLIVYLFLLKRGYL